VALSLLLSLIIRLYRIAHRYDLYRYELFAQTAARSPLVDHRQSAWVAGAPSDIQ
jgi:hypothetical protein